MVPVRNVIKHNDVLRWNTNPASPELLGGAINLFSGINLFYGILANQASKLPITQQQSCKVENAGGAPCRRNKSRMHAVL